MKSAFLSYAVLSIGTATAAFGQCSALGTLTDIATANGGVVVNEYADADRSLFFSATSDGTVILYITGPGDASHLCADYSEDGNGVGTLTDGSVVCTIKCGGAGVGVTVEGSDVKLTTIVVSKEGNFVVAGSAAFSKVFKEAFGWDQEGAETLEVGNAIDETNSTASGTNSMAQEFTVTAAHQIEPMTDGTSTATFFVGTLTAGQVNVPFAGYSLTTDGHYYIIPMVAFADESQGAEVVSFLAAYQSRQHPVCSWEDATADGEWVDLQNDLQACRDSADLKAKLWALGCGVGGGISCLISIIPNPVTPVICIGAIGCLGLDGGFYIWHVFAEDIETQRVEACICNHATVRHNGGTTSSCTYTCPAIF